jgi:hypothetical protein
MDTRTRRELAALAAVALLTGAAWGTETTRRPAAAEPARPNPTKFEVESPTKTVVGASATLADANPKVRPGLVRWHASFQEACNAARRSGKPVLLFQMMGRLDHQFC